TPISLSQYVSGSIDVPGQLNFYTFTANAGQRIYLQQFNGFVPFSFMNVTIFNPDTSTLIAATPYDVDTFALTQTGTYAVRRSPYYRPGAPGAYTSNVWAVPPLTPTPIGYDQIVSGNLAAPGEQDVYAFNGLAGDQVVLNITQNSGQFGNLKAFTILA